MPEDATDLRRAPSSPPEYSRTEWDDAELPYQPTLEDVIPETHEQRTLVLCFDGTGDQFDDDNSNVVNLFSMLKKDDPSKQLVYYQSGIGTYNIPQIARPWMAKFQRVVDMMVGIHLNAHVMSGYEFLMQNYQVGDKICIFGFSRGAYTARALAGMIHKVGLLPRYNHQQVPFAYKMYSREDETGWRLSTAFKKSFSIDVDIDFLGLWDTVGSVGIIPKRLPFTSSNTSVRHFRHALSLDEHRARFLPSLWDRTLPKRHKFGMAHGTMPKSRGKRMLRAQRSIQHHNEQNDQNGQDGKDTKGNGSTDKDKDKEPPKTLKQLEREYDKAVETENAPTDVEEVWFAGCHCDIGGGAVKNETRNSLARIPLRWMIRECFKLETGILFHREMLKLAGLDPSTLYPVLKQRPPALSTLPSRGPSAAESSQSARARAESSSSGAVRPGLSTSTSSRLSTTSIFLDHFSNEEEEDVKDVLSPINDMLKTDRGWWILEVFPYRLKYQNSEDSWVQKVSWANMGRARHIPHKRAVKVHRSVKVRMEAEAELVAEGKKYVPKPLWNFEPVWVD